jgi:parallel beta-helix repeat protein
MKRRNFIYLITLFFIFTGYSCKKSTNNNNDSESYFLKKQFVHPGMSQSKADLDFMRSKVLQKEEPWYGAFKKLELETELDFKPEPFTYISVGAYRANDRGGKEFFASAKMAYNHALMWYITQDKIYAEKAIEILNAWSYKLWGFDANNAKLNVGLMGHYFLNTAEILRYTESGWKEKDIEQFERLVLTVFHPTIKDFFTEANGNWDASMIATMLCIAIFTDNHEVFNLAAERFYRGEGNSGITKYIYQGGQCQETTRDWGHVQLGLGELSKAAQIAWTQGVDFYSAADNRLAQGYEYTACFLLEQKGSAFGEVSYKDMEHKKDIYESIYNHYATIKGINLTYTKQIIDKFTREKSSQALLSSTRHTDDIIINSLATLKAEQKIKPTETGALYKANNNIPKDAIWIVPGESIQEAIDKNKGTNRWIVLKKGVHWLEQPLKMQSGIILAGEGRESILILRPEISAATIINANYEMNNVTIRDLLIEGATNPGTPFDPNHERNQRLYTYAQSREGIAFMSDSIGKMRNIELKNITVQNFTKNGVLISGASDIQIYHCDLDNNGSSVVPGPYFHHNLRLTHAENCEIRNSRFDSSLWGNGVDISFCNNILLSDNEAARNKLSGIYCTDNQNIIIVSNLLEGNDKDGITIDKLKDESENIIIQHNLIQYNSYHSIFMKSNNVILQQNTAICNKYNM